MKDAPKTIGIYIHIPFCRHKCFYCDFVSIAGREDLIDGYVEAVVREIEEKSDIVRERRAVSVFFGGGTPSMLYPEQMETILGTLRAGMKIARGAETTVEMNPESVTREKLEGYRAAGVNRVSLGVQSLDEDQLKFLERVHTADDARRAVEDVFGAGFDNVSVDMIFGLPGQTMKSWMSQLREAMTWGLSHVSLYEITPERGTPLKREVDKGAVQLSDMADDMYDAAETLLASFHFNHYEISNWARPGFECVHNVGYWENRDYLGIGAAAHSKIEGKRWENERGVETYIQRTLQTGSAVAQSEKLTPGLIRTERLMLGLRLARGVAMEGIEITQRMEEMIRGGMLEVSGGRLRATARGWRLLDSVLEKL